MNEVHKYYNQLLRNLFSMLIYSNSCTHDECMAHERLSSVFNPTSASIFISSIMLFPSYILFYLSHPYLVLYHPNGADINICSIEIFIYLKADNSFRLL